MGLPCRPDHTVAPPGLAHPTYDTVASSSAESDAIIEQNFIDSDADDDNNEGDSSDDEAESGAPGYMGAIFTFKDSSRWKLTQALSPIKYQQGTPPFEARQVFDCLCIEDPKGIYQEDQKAVIKVKYQVEGTNEAVFFFRTHVMHCRKRVALFTKKRTTKERGREAYEEALSEAKYANYLYPLAIGPAPFNSLHTDTRHEATALRNFQEFECAHAPHLLNIRTDYLLEEVDHQAMPGGYAVFMLMTKVPGEALDRKSFWNMDEDTREEVRRAFKVAIMDLWDCGIKPQDRNLNNLIWDVVEHKCYFVDFEDYDIVHKGEEPEAIWTDDYYRSWRIAEECKPCTE